MTKNDKQKSLVLIIIIALLGLSLFYNNHASRPEPPPLKEPVTAQSHSTIVRSVSQMDELPSLPLLARQAPPFVDSRRNVFEFGADEMDPASNTEDPEQSADQTEPDTQAAVQSAPGSEITFVGLYTEKEKPGTRLAFISVAGKVLVVREGDSVSGIYHVADIGDDDLTLTVDANHQTLQYKLGHSLSN